MPTAAPSPFLDRVLAAVICGLGPFVLAGYLLGGAWRQAASYGYTVLLSGVVTLFLWMLLGDGVWDQSQRQGRKLMGRFAKYSPRFVSRRWFGWLAVALVGSTVLTRTVEHLT